MGTAARTLLDRLDRAAWFARSGTQPARPATLARSWSDAAHAGASHDWTNALIAASNAFAAAALTTPARSDRWNAIASEQKPRCAALVMARLAASPLASWVGGATLSPGPASAAEQQAIIDRAIAAPTEPDAGTLLLGNLEWLILHAAIEAELGGPVAGFFRRGADWLADGYFPCGWRAGALLVY